MNERRPLDEDPQYPPMAIVHEPVIPHGKTAALDMSPADAECNE